jgi:hypothetical protein
MPVSLPPLTTVLVQPRPAPIVARRILGGGLLAGTIGALAFAQDGRGLGLSLYLLALAAAVGGLTRSAFRTLPGRVTALLAAGAAFALLPLLRSSEVLTFFNSLAALFFITLASAFAKPGATRSLADTRVRDLVALLPTGALEAITGAPRFLFGDASAAFAGRDAGSSSTSFVSIARAAALGLLLIGIFTLLLSGGDPVFRSLVTWPAWWQAPALPEYLLRFGLFAVPALALAWSTTRPSTAPDDILANGITLTRLDVVVALASLNALFAVYLLLQLRVLFGGSAYLLATTGLTVAQYARSGFFALTVAAGLVLTVLLGLNALLRSERLGGWAVSRRLATALLVMVGLMLVSALARMMLYVERFGISIDRLIALAVIAWLALTSLWFTLTVLRERTTRFVIGAVVAGCATLVTLNLINPEAVVARSAAARAASGTPFDTEYAIRELSADAVPALTPAFRSGAVADCALATSLLVRWGDPSLTPLASWTLADARAWASVARERALLQAACTASVP